MEGIYLLVLYYEEMKKRDYGSKERELIIKFIIKEDFKIIGFNY